MKFFCFFFFFFLSCCSQDFFLNHKNDRLYDLILKSSEMWQINLKITKKENEKSDHLFIISKNLKCQEPELIEYADYCEQEIMKLKNDYSEIMAFCLTEINNYGVIKKSHIVINDMFFYSFYWEDQTKINVIAHEIGHCLGLKHIYKDKNIMYPFRQNGYQNFNPQKTILKNYYLNKIEPSKEETNDFFQNYKQYFLKYEKLPLFYVKI